MRLPSELLDDLSAYSDWLFDANCYFGRITRRHRDRHPNWTKQAKPEWIELLQQIGVLELGDGAEARFTDVGLELLNLF